jgi:maltooligosyltrehalose trehalohydrolase
MFDTIDVLRRRIGVNIINDNAEVCVWSPTAQSVAIRVCNKNETLPLEQKEYGYWFLETRKINEGDRYKFVLDEEKEFPDPGSLSQPDGVHESSEVIDLKTFNWTDNDWNNLPLKDYIIYELHTGTFTPEGTFYGIEEKLDYLKDLGITAIEIMPVAQFPGNRNWGYDGVFPFAVQNSYGGAKGLQQLVNACHQKGLVVILDVVYNHLGPEGNYLGAYGPYFTAKYNTPWGNAINFDDAWCDGVRNYFIENALMWFRDFHIDALRLDAVHAIKDFSPTHILQEIKKHVDALEQATGRTHYLIVESDLNDTCFIEPLEKNGYGMDAQWIDEFHHALRVTAGEKPAGYYSDFSGIAHLAKAYNDAYVYDGQYSLHRKKKFGVKANINDGKHFVFFTQNHDQVGNRMLGERTSQLVSFEMQKLLAAAVMCSPYLPMLFMGEEWSETNPFLYFVSHTDENLVEAVHKGRKEEFAAFHAEGEAPDPVSEETFLQSKLQWHLLDEAEHKVMLAYYKELIQLRKSLPALAELNRQNLKVDYSEKHKTLLLHRWHNDQHVLCCMNFSNKEQVIQNKKQANDWFKIFDSADPKWNGSKAAAEMVSESFLLQAESIVIYKNQTL